MSQSKMSATDDTEKKFVIKHVFKDVMNMEEGETMNGPVEYHFKVPWKIRIWRDSGRLIVFLDCSVHADHSDWLMTTETSGKLVRETDEIPYSGGTVFYEKDHPFCRYHSHLWNDIHNAISDGNFMFEFTAIIKKVIGLDLDATRKLKHFDNESAKEDSDVTLIVKDQKFHVLKKYLAHHSTYFKSLFSGNFAESEKSEVELKDIDPDDFQKFLELIYGDSLVEDYSVLKILHLADFFDSNTAIKRCQEFLIQKSELPLHQLFGTALKYNLEELKIQCISEMNSATDLKSIVPEDSDDFDKNLWKELFLKSVSLIPK